MVAKCEQPASGSRTLKGRTLYIPQMAYAGSRLTAAVFRSCGIDAQVTPASDGRTLELGGLHTSGEECFPHKVTVGDFLKVMHEPGFEPERTAFLMPTAHGPCRFGQYAPYLKQLMTEMGYPEVMVVSPTSANGYDGVAEYKGGELLTRAWMGVVVGDVLTKFLLKTRPYETRAGDTDAVYEDYVDRACTILEEPDLPRKQRLGKLVAVITQARDRFRAIPARYEKGRPLIGLVGEIFCRLNNFSNEDVARRIEKLGGECWLSDIAEWIWYTNWYSHRLIVNGRGRLNLDFLKHKLKTHFQHEMEQALLAPVAEDFVGYEEPHDIREVLSAAEPYLPAEGSIGEMVLSTGKTIYLHKKGVDGIIDISPFTCMNGIICEAIYPALSQAHDDLPIRVLYFDGANTSLDRDLEIFLDLTRAYQTRKKHPRLYNRFFQ